MKAHPFPTIEVLEHRIAPAALAGQLLTYTDLDGDHVSITISKGTLAPADFTFNVANPFGANAAAPMQLQKMDLHSVAGIAGANLTMKVTKAGSGDGLAAIGEINAIGVDLGAVTLVGDLGAIEAGSNGATNTAIKALSVRSLGLYGEATQSNASPTLTSFIQGHLGSLTIKSDLATGITVNVSDATATNSGIGPISIGGSLFGTLKSSGGGLGLITVKGSILGGLVAESAGPIAGLKVTGSVLLNAAVTTAAGAIGPITIGGSLYDGASLASPAGTIGTVKIGGSVYAQSAITAAGNIGAVTLGGSLSGSQISITGTGAITSVSIGGDIVNNGIVHTNAGKLGNVTVKGTVADGSGVITSSGDLGAVKIGGNLQTGAQIVSGGALGAVTIGASGLGNIQAMNGITSVSIRGEFSAQLETTGGNIGAVTVGGDMTGATITSAGTLGAIKITGLLADSNISSVGSIASLTVGKSVNSSQILAGAQTASASPVNIGAVKVGGDWIASNLSAGVKGSAGNFGDATDSQLALTSRITSITIAGIIAGSPTTASHFGFDAQAIGSFTDNKIKLKLPTTFPANIPLDPILHDVAIELI